MSGICSRHQSHDPGCARCTAIPLTEEERIYYRGWEDALAAQRRNGWYPVENCVLDGLERLETAARGLKNKSLALHGAIDEIEAMRKLNRGFAPSRKERYSP